jgi:ATP-dependent exoDNAse (exonuclease V) beta subunit
LLAQSELPGLKIEILPPGEAVDATATTRLTTQTLHRLPATWQWPANVTQVLQPQAATVSPATALPERLAARIGELVHLGLRMLTEHGDAWLQRGANLPFWRRALLPFTHNEDAAQRALQTVQQHLQRCLAAPEAAWLFRSTHQDSACELALCDYSSGWRRDYVVDRTFIDSDGTRWIVDYKSTTPAAGQSLADFYEEQVAIYRDQLQTYARLLGGSDATPPRLALFFTGLPALHVLD